MNLLAVFCYITVTCDPPAALKPATVAAPTTAVALPQVRSPSVTATRNMVAPLSVDGGGRPQQQLLQQEQQRQQQEQLQQQKQRSKPVVRETEMSTYPTRYDYIDVEAIMSNDRIIKILFNCVLNRGPCTREGLELKSKFFRAHFLPLAPVLQVYYLIARLPPTSVFFPPLTTGMAPSLFNTKKIIFLLFLGNIFFFLLKLHVVKNYIIFIYYDFYLTTLRHTKNSNSMVDFLCRT